MDSDFIVAIKFLAVVTWFIAGLVWIFLLVKGMITRTRRRRQRYVALRITDLEYENYFLNRQQEALIKKCGFTREEIDRLADQMDEENLGPEIAHGGDFEGDR